MRTVSLFPSATELVAGLGATDDLVGRSHQCDRPEAVRDVPAVTASRLSDAAPADPGDIDAAVDDHAHGDGTFFRVLADRLEAADPEVVLTQSLCEVCAVPESMTAGTLERLDADPELISLEATTVDDVLAAVDRLGRALRRESDAARLRQRLETRRERLRERRPTPPRPPRVVCLEWTDPLRCHGLWVPEMLEDLGAEAGFGDPGERGRVVDWEDVLAYDPEVLVVSPCGRPISDVRTDANHLVERPGWEGLSAVEDGRVYLLNGKLSSRHGPRVVRTMELLATVLYPDAFDDEPRSRDEVVRFCP
jgi:iron complex transport system substrate-binding protein